MMLPRQAAAAAAAADAAASALMSCFAALRLPLSRHASLLLLPLHYAFAAVFFSTCRHVFRYAALICHAVCRRRRVLHAPRHPLSYMSPAELRCLRFTPDAIAAYALEAMILMFR